MKQCKAAEKSSLKSQLLKSHGILLFISLIVLVSNLFVFYWNKHELNKILNTDFPITHLSKDLRYSVHESIENLHGWLGNGKSGHKDKHEKIWSERIIPELNEIQLIIDGQKQYKLSQEVRTLKSKIFHLKDWQWRIYDVYETPGNMPNKMFFKVRLQTINKKIDSLTLNLINDLSERNVAPKIMWFLTKFNHDFNESVAQLKNYTVTGSKAQLMLNRNNLIVAKKQIERTSDLLHELTFSQKGMLSQLIKQFNLYYKLEAKLDGSRGMGLYNSLTMLWMNEEINPLIHSIDESFSYIVKKESENLSNSYDNLQYGLNVSIYFIMVSIAMLCLLSWKLAYYSARKILSPINSLIDATRQLAYGKLDSDIAVTNNNEIGELTDSFNKMRTQRLLAEKRVKSVIEMAVDAILTINFDGIVTSCNASAMAMFGYEEHELIGQNISIIIPEPHRSNHDAYLKKYMLTHVKKIIGRSRELTAVRKSGEIFPVQLSVSENVVNNEHFFTGIIRDLTESHQQAKKAEDMSKQLIHAQKLESIGQLAGGIAHEFNNILHVISGLSELINKQLLSAKLNTEHEERIRKAISRASILTSKLLNFSHKKNTVNKAFQPNACVDEALQLFGQTINKKLSLYSHYNKFVSLIDGDEDQITQIILNLCINASDAMNDYGAIYVATDQVHFSSQADLPSPQLHAGDYVTISIRDTGCGMSDEQLERIFEPFYTTKPVGKGTGLGLSVVYGILSDHNAVALVESVIDGGTTFTLYFPTSKFSAVPLEKAPASSKQAITSAEDFTILVVDDEEGIRGILGIYLSELHFNVIFATNGVEAVKCMSNRDNKIDLICMDMTMPEMSGFKAYEEILKICPDSKVIFMSGYSDDVIADDLMNSPNVCFIKKPFEFEQLDHAIAILLKLDDDISS